MFLNFTLKFLIPTLILLISPIAQATFSPELQEAIDMHIQKVLVPTTIGANYCHNEGDSYALLGKFWDVMSFMELTEAEEVQIQAKLEKTLKPFEDVYVYDIPMKDWPKENLNAVKKLCKGPLREFDKKVYMLRHITYNTCVDMGNELLEANMPDIRNRMAKCLGLKD